VAIVFVYQWESEGMDLPSLALSGNQNELVSQVAAANPHTIVVIESGTAVTMPWVNNVGGILEVWYGGSRGAEALANILFGDVDPSGKLPMTFPRSDADLPHPTIVQPPPGTHGHEGPNHWKEVAKGFPAFQIHYDEGLRVGYKWYDAENKPVLFPFGYGLSYTTYSYSNLKVEPGATTRVSFTVTNTGNRPGAEIAEVYAALPPNAGEPPKRLVGWSKIPLSPGENKEVTLEIEPKLLSIYDVSKNGWELVPGNYTFLVGGSSQNLPLKQAVELH
jgi:beta-glucosidase